jgi:hypothetical protein
MTATIGRERIFLLFFIEIPMDFQQVGPLNIFIFKRGNIDKDNINHPSESRNFFPKGCREFP